MVKCRIVIRDKSIMERLMSMPAFLQKKQEQQKKQKKSNKGNFRTRCLQLLATIKSYNEDHYHDLHKTFHGKYDKENIQKKLILGFYAHLKDVIRQYKVERGEVELNKAIPLPKKSPVEVKKEVKPKKVELKVVKEADKKAAKKKVLKKPAAKKAKKEVVAKKAKKKVVAKKKVAKKAKKKVVAKKKVAKKAKKKVVAKKTVAKTTVRRKRAA